MYKSINKSEIVKRAKKKLKEMNLMDNLLFQNILADPVYGEPFCRMLLEIILGRKIGNIKINAEKAFYGIDSDKKGVRLDLLILERRNDDDNLDKTGDRNELPDIIFDVEPQDYNIEAGYLPRRTRYYHSIIDTKMIPSGALYPDIPDVYVIMFVNDDPFGDDRMVYTINNTVKENPAIPYDDGSMTVFFFTKGRKGEVSEDLKDFLNYMRNTGPETAVNDVLKKMQEIVEHIKEKAEVSKMIIDYEEVHERMKAEGRAEGRAEGIAEQKEFTEREKARADAAEQKIKELEAEIARLRKELKL